MYIKETSRDNFRTYGLELTGPHVVRYLIETARICPLSRRKRK